MLTPGAHRGMGRCCQDPNSGVRSVKWVILPAIMVTLLAVGCTARIEPTRGEVIVPAVKIETGLDGRFCPPGQAKKGRC